MAPRRPLLLALLLAVGAVCAEGELRNWFDDPFLQISAFVPDCPLPAGPFVDAANRGVQAHRRAERGTTCWLAKVCDRPNSYAYDRDIAAAFQAGLQQGNPFAGTTLWVTVQGRVVYVEGCATRESAVAEIEAYARRLPYVEQAIAIVRTDPAARPPYKVR